MQTVFAAVLPPQSPQAVWSYDYGAFQQVRSDDHITMVALLVLVIGGLLAFAFLRSRTRLAEQRLATLRELAGNGHLSPQQVDAFLRPSRRFATVALVIGWFLLIGGVGMLTAAVAEGWPTRHSDLGQPSVALLAVALATMSTPIMLREFRRQGVA